MTTTETDMFKCRICGERYRGYGNRKCGCKNTQFPDSLEEILPGDPVTLTYTFQLPMDDGKMREQVNAHAAHTVLHELDTWLRNTAKYTDDDTGQRTEEHVQGLEEARKMLRELMEDSHVYFAE